MGELRRRQALIAAAVFSGAAAISRSPAAAATPPDDAFSALETQSNALARQYNAWLGVYAADLLSSRIVGYREGDRFAVCSTQDLRGRAGSAADRSRPAAA